jgi:hypothetical protein
VQRHEAGGAGGGGARQPQVGLVGDASGTVDDGVELVDQRGQLARRLRAATRGGRCATLARPRRR